ncbi:hypothetical protein A3B57_03005 [Microgenomates group bacterium RIFCSPLOWO2_01_FULL_47_10]|nr:MAG: hypothetical protein A3B57_03005 [Microgenomates group bacterium RIFCSPLOWO2_01_FULL_47_10]
MQTWLIYSLIAGLFSIAMQYVNRRGLRGKHDPTAYAWWFEVIRTLFFLLLLPFDYSVNLTSAKDVVSLIIPGLIEIAAVYSFMKMFAHAQLSVSTIISRLRLIWLPLFAVLFLGEILTFREYIGIVLIFLGAVGTTSIKQIRADPGIRHSFLFAIFAGLLSITMKTASSLGSTSVVMLAMSIPSIMALPFLMKHPLARLKISGKVRLKHNLLATLCNSVAMILYLSALRMAPVGLVFSVFNGIQVLSVIVGIIAFKETDQIPQKLLGTAVSFAGILLLA